MTSVLRVLCFAVPGLALVVAALFAISDNGGGFLPHLGRSLGLAVLAAGVVVSWMLNALYLWQARGPKWLAIVTAVQTLPVLYVGWGVASYLLNQRKDAQAREQVAAIRDAIGRDEVTAFDIAKRACGERCMQFIDGEDGMAFLAADIGGTRIAQSLVAGMRPDHVLTTGHGQNSFRTCDGDMLYANAALSAAVVRNNTAMVDLLLPRSDSASRREAMWTAARLDRLTLVQHMMQAGVPINWRGAILDENNTLLIAAAEGAAVRTGAWLIEAQHMPVNAILTGPDPYKGSAPVRIVMSASRDGTAPGRIAEFLRLLVSHGADIDAPWDDEEPSALTEMVRRGDRQGVELLLAAGAHRERLSPERRALLDKMLKAPLDSLGTVTEFPTGCVTPGD